MQEPTDQPTHQHSPKTVAHANGLTFKVIDGSSNFARVARNVRQLAMADGSTWTVGLPIGWRGIEAAWKNTETPEQAAARIHAYGESTARRDRRQLGLRIATRTAVRPAAWTDDDNEPAIPRIPGPRKPGVTAALDLIGAGA